MNINAQDAINAAKNVAENAKNSIGETTKVIKDKINDLQSKLGEEKKGNSDNIIDKAKGMASDVLHKGSDLLDGLADKIK